MSHSKWLVCDCMFAGFIEKIDTKQEKRLKVQEVEDNICDQKFDVNNKKSWSAFRCTGEVTVGRGVLEWEKTDRGADKEWVDKDREEWCVQLISRISHWTFLQGGWGPYCESEVGVPDEAHVSSGQQSHLSDPEARRERAPALEGLRLQRALPWLEWELGGQLPPSPQVGWSWVQVLREGKKRKKIRT